MYKNYSPRPQLPVQNPDFDSAPNADNGKLQMYKHRSGMPYSNGAYVTQKALDVGAGMPPGAVVHPSHEDPHYGSYPARRRSTP